VPDFWLAPRGPIPASSGTNRVNWNIRYDDPPAFSHNYAQVMGAVKGDTPASPEGPLALPGVYTVKLTVNGKSYTEKLTIKNDPRSPATAGDLAAQHALQMKLYDGARQAWDAYHQVAAMREQIAALNVPAEAREAVAAFDKKLEALAGNPAASGRGGFGRGGPATPPTFVGLNGGLLRQLDTLDFGDMAPNEPMQRAYAASCGDLGTAIATWRTLNGEDLTALNRVLTVHQLKPVAAAAPLPARPACGPPAGAKTTPSASR
jgi:hypothetical protein